MAIFLNDTIESAIYTFLSEAVGSGVTVIWGTQAQQRPGYPYVSAIIHSIVNEGRPQHQHVHAETFKFDMRRAFTLSCVVFAKSGHLTIHNAIMDALEIISKKVPLQSAGIAIREINPLGDLTSFNKDIFVKSSGIDVIMAYSYNVEDDLDIVEVVEYSGEVSGFSSQPGRVAINDWMLDFSNEENSQYIPLI